MLSHFAGCRGLAPLSRACARAVMASALLLAGAGSVHDATATGDTRTISFHHTHSGEDLTVTFKRDGRYDEEALKQLNHYLRDWRSQEQTAMDRHLFDIIWEVNREVGGKQPIQIISSYRSPATNAMLRRRSAHTGVARFSQHMLGHAMDFFIPGVPLEEIRFAGLRLQRGGVGFYPTSGSPFVHLDTGNVRHWPRMTRQQLVRVFPNGRTVHVPSDGNPLPGYELALADLERRKASGEVGSSDKPSLLASLFAGKHTSDDDEEAAPAASAASPAKSAPAALVASVDASKGEVPLPRAKPAAIQLADASPQTAAAASPTKSAPAALVASVDAGKAEVPLPQAKPAAIQLADASPQPAALPAPKPIPSTADAKVPASTAKPTTTAGKPVAINAAAQTPSDIINARGFWDEEPAKPTAAQVAALAARNAVASPEPQSTASVPAMSDATSKAMAYAPPSPSSPPIDRSHIVTASLPAVSTPSNLRVSALARDAVTSIAASAAAKRRHDANGVITATRIAPAGNINSVWLRAMIVTPSASQVSMIASTLGDPDLTVLRPLFVKPTDVVAMTFADDPLMGMSCDHFAGAATAPLTKTSFALRTVAQR